MGFGVRKEGRWPDGIVPYQFVLPAKNDTFYNNAIMLITIIERCMTQWMQFVNTDGLYITFSKKAEPTVVGKLDDPDVKYIRLMGSKAMAGGNGKFTGKNPSNICLIPIDSAAKDIWKTIPHELGHILGLSHENERNGLLIDHPYRQGDIPRLCHNFTREQIKDPFLGPWRGHLSAVNNNDGHGDYDPESIMHYPAFDAFVWNCRTDETGDPNGVKAAVKILEGEKFKMKLNYPDLIDVAPEVVDPKTRLSPTWAPSKGDIKIIQFMYPKREKL